MVGAEGCLSRRDVRYGSKADMCSAQADVRFVPIADIQQLTAYFLMRGLISRERVH
jgi:hypothetical protein